jgi:predicted transcriptional regulator
VQNIATIAFDPTIKSKSVTELAINVSSNSFMDRFNSETDVSLARLKEILEFVEMLTISARKVVQEAILMAIQEIAIAETSESIIQAAITQEFLTDVSNDCKNILRYLTYALIGTDKLVLEHLSLISLQRQYESLQIQFLVTVVKQIQILINPMLKDCDIVTELDEYFASIITRIDTQDPAKIREKQRQGLAKLAEEWLAEDLEDPNEQEETWNYLRDALNHGTLSHRPIPA